MTVLSVRSRRSVRMGPALLLAAVLCPSSECLMANLTGYPEDYNDWLCDACKNEITDFCNLNQ